MWEGVGEMCWGVEEGRKRCGKIWGEVWGCEGRYEELSVNMRNYKFTITSRNYSYMVCIN